MCIDMAAMVDSVDLVNENVAMAAYYDRQAKVNVLYNAVRSHPRIGRGTGSNVDRMPNGRLRDDLDAMVCHDMTADDAVAFYITYQEAIDGVCNGTIKI